jgi:aspartyl-tRNA(Asn)/glutamyl-tRNA(Gln) amidotransferase subunit C
MSDLDIERLAMLARVYLSSEEKKRLKEDLQFILNQVSRLLEVDVEGVSPTFGSDINSVCLHEDKPHESMKLQKVLDNAPSIKDSYIKVAKSLGEDY